MKQQWKKLWSALALGCLGNVAIAGEPVPTGTATTTAPSLIQQAPPVPGVGQALDHTPVSPTLLSSGGAHCATERPFIPPMIGDLFYGGLRASGGGFSGNITRFVGFGTSAAELIPINLGQNAPRGTFTSSGLPNDPFVSINSVTGLSTRTVIALQENPALISLARNRFPGAKFVSSQAVPQGLVGQIPGLQGLVPGDPSQFPGPPVGVLTVPPGQSAVIQGPFPGSEAGKDLVLPGGSAITDGDLYMILNTINVPGSGGGIFLPEPGGFSRHTRISENGFVLPTDRVFTNYNYLNGVLNGSDTNAFMVGVEKTFFDGTFSVQVNLPIYASTLANAQDLDSNLGSHAGQIGNVSVWLKYLAYQSDTVAVSLGLGVNTPTGEDIRVTGGGTEVLRVVNESPLINPFVGALWMPTEDLFVQGFTQLDIDTCGNPVFVNGERIGPMRSALLYYIGVGAGYVLYNDASSTISSVIPMAELHYATNIGDGKTVSSDLGSIAYRSNGIDTLNATAGVNIGIGQSAYLTLGGGVPIIGSRDRQYDWQAMAQLNVLFGGPRR